MTALGVLTALSPAEQAAACRNVVAAARTPELAIAQAEHDLANGRAGEAAATVRGRYPAIRELGPSAPPLARRATRIYALALVRADGWLDGSRGWSRWANLEWAVETLRELDELQPNDPTLEADLAEARMRLPRTRSTGARVLTDLDRRDLLGSAFGYLALARYRRAQDDVAGARAAEVRCKRASAEELLCETDVSGELAAPIGSGILGIGTR